MNGKYVFASILGTQLMGTFQPLLSLVQKVGPVKSFFILTPQIKTNLEPRLAEVEAFAARHNLGPVEILAGSDRREDPEYIPRLLRLIAEDAASEDARLCFNIDGGMNYLLSDAVFELEPFKPLYIQTSRTRGIIHDTAQETFTQIRLPQALPVEELLALQGVTYAQAGNQHADVCRALPLAAYIKANAIPTPANALTNIEIGGVIFDHVWNPGNNRLHFLKDWRFELENPDDWKVRERDFANWSKNRTRCGHMHDKEVIAIVHDDKSAQRLADGSGGKIRVVQLQRKFKNWTDTGEVRKQPGKDYHVSKSPTEVESVRAALNVQLPKVRECELKQPEPCQLEPMPDNTLVVALGDNFITTFLAIASHKPDHLILCHDRSTSAIVETARRIVENADALGLQSVRIAHLAVEGSHPGLVLPKAEAGARVTVNISPGTKGQTAALTRWAIANGHEVWSLVNQQRICSPLTPGLAKPAVPLDLFDPALVLRLLGRKLLSEGIPGAELPDVEALDAMLAFMRSAAAAGLDINAGFRSGRLRVGNDSMQHKGGELWLLTVGGKTYKFRKRKNGAWYEQLCARALMNAGASCLRLNLKLAWDEELEKRICLRNQPEEIPHQLESDVLACFEGDLVLISAKSYPLQETVTSDYQDRNGNPLPTLAQVADDAVNTGAYLGPFTLTMASDMGSSKRTHGDRTVILGWRELCQPEILANEIRGLRKKRSTNRDLSRLTGPGGENRVYEHGISG